MLEEVVSNLFGLLLLCSIIGMFSPYRGIITQILAILAFVTQLILAATSLILGKMWVFDLMYGQLSTVALFTTLHMLTLLVCLVLLFSARTGVYWRIFAGLFLLADIIAFVAGILSMGGMVWPVMGPYLLMFYV